MKHHSDMRAQIHRVVFGYFLSVEDQAAVHLTGRNSIIHPVLTPQKGGLPTARGSNEGRHRAVNDIQIYIKDGLFFAIKNV